MQTATITITGSNDAPTVSSAITSTASEDDAAYSLDLLTNVSDPDSTDTLNVTNLTLVSGDASGVTVSGNSLSIDPGTYNALADGESEVISYIYEVEDGNGGSVVQTATITITGSNDAPTVSSAVTSTASEDDTAYSLNLLANASDPDSTDTLNVTNLTLVSGDASGVTVSGNSLSIDPNAYNALATGESEVITYSYDVEDGNGGSVAQTATITITGSNDAPVISAAQTLSNIQEDNSLLITQAQLLNGSSDPENDALTVQNVTVQSGSGTVTNNGDGTWTFEPTDDWAGDVVLSYQVSDGSASTGNTASFTVNAVADAPVIGFDSDVINSSSGANEIPPPASTGLLLSFYDELNNTDRDAALQEGVIDPASATSSERVINGIGTTKFVTDSGSVQSDGSTIEIDTGDSYSVTGLIFLEEGSTYQFMGFHDDSLRIELGGTTMVSTTGDSWGNYGPGTSVVGNSFTAPASGYYTLEAFVNNVTGIGQFSINVIVNGEEARELDGTNFNIYSSVGELAAVGGQFGNFVVGADNADGGYFPQQINSGLVDNFIEISNDLNLDCIIETHNEEEVKALTADTDGSENIISVTISGIPVGSVLTDGTNEFEATTGNTSIDILSASWDTSNIQIKPPEGFAGTFQISVTAVSQESSNLETASTVETIDVTVVDPIDAGGDVDTDILGDHSIRYGTESDDTISVLDTTTNFAINTNNVSNDSTAFNFDFATVSTQISSISIALSEGTWDPGSGGGSYGFVVGSQSAGLTLTASNFSVTDSDTVMTIDMSGQTIVDGSAFAFGVDFDGITGGNNQGGLLADVGELTVTLADGRTMVVTIDDAGDSDINTASATLGGIADITDGLAGDDTITGSAADDLIIGGFGDDTISGLAGHDAIQGGAGADSIDGGAGDDLLSGDAGADILVGGDGEDIIFGGTGSDLMTGGNDSDTFAWRSEDGDGSTDTILDFTLGSGGDVLQLADLLIGETDDAATLDAYLDISSDGLSSTIVVDADGVGSDADLTITLQGVDLTSLGANDQQIIQQLLNDNNLFVDL